MATSAEELNSKNEIVLKVPPDLALHSLGFAMDAGGSVTKLLYRSKEDYENGKRKTNADSDHGLLRLRYFPAGEDENLINFLRNHCDILDSARRNEDGWMHTGVQTQRFKGRMEEVLQIKIKTMSETDANTKGLQGFYSQVHDCRPLGISPESADHAVNTVRGFLDLILGSKQFGDEGFSDNYFKGDPQFIAQCINKLRTIDGATLAPELSHYEFEWPVLLANLGSGDAMAVVYDDGKYDFATFSGVSGRTFLSLGKVLCGAKDFDELVEMASRGDHQKVDVMSGDMKVKNRKEEDWYSAMPEDHVIFTLGKLGEDSFKGTYTKEDVAAGLLNMVLSAIAKTVFMTARAAKVKSVVFAGSVVSRKVTRDVLQKWVLEDSLMQPFIGEEPLKWIFLPHCGFICAFGAWYHNWETEHKGKNIYS